MSRQLKGLQPEKVFYYFEEINNIPRESGNEKQLSDYMVDFAIARDLEFYQDESNNVVIKKAASLGYEDAPAVILQGHLDMVCEKNEGTVHDFTKDPIKMLIEGDWITADGTTLGADNGIALAYSLALLDGDYEHPAIEVVFTVDEEVGLTGAQSLDKSILKAKYFINLDSEEDGELTVGCSGGLKAGIHIPISPSEKSYEKAMVKRIEIKNLKGGHSGVDINKNRANADRLMGRLLAFLEENVSIRLVNIAGGTKDNVIPRECVASVVFEEGSEEIFNKALQEITTILKDENRTVESDMTIIAYPESVGVDTMFFSKETTMKILFTLTNAPNGVQTMSADLENMVESSLNVGKCAVEGDKVEFLFAVRSNVRSLRDHITNQLLWFADMLDVEFFQTADYPEWPFKPDSNLLRTAAEIYESMFGTKPIIKAIHAGLEPGAFLEKLPHLDAISFGPDLVDVHSPDERLNIASAARNWEYLLAILKALK